MGFVVRFYGHFFFLSVCQNRKRHFQSTSGFGPQVLGDVASDVDSLSFHSPTCMCMYTVYDHINVFQKLLVFILTKKNLPKYQGLKPNPKL